jgi:hypothetical protein
MAKMPVAPYSDEIRTYMLRHYGSLHEKGRRQYAAIEAVKLGHGGIGYVCALFGLHRDTVSLGIEELKKDELPPPNRIRRVGGGRKVKSVDKDDDLLAKFTQVVDTYRAGCPMNEGVRFTHLSPGELREAMVRDHGERLSKYLILRLLSALGMSRRSLSKTGTAKRVEGRNEQFETIKALVEQYRSAGHAIYSVDGKKKEYLGSLHRPGQVYCEQPLVCQDHDFPSLAAGQVRPYGVYDVMANRGYLYLNESADTSDYAADCLDRVLSDHHKKQHPSTTKILLLADSGGSNAANRYRYKEMLQWLADKHELEIRVAHYPSYCSKYNPCDHRLFPAITKAWSGVMLPDVATMRDLVKARARTTTGLRVWVRQVKKKYELGVKATKEFTANCTAIFEDKLPQWNYSFKPTVLSC